MKLNRFMGAKRQQLMIFLIYHVIFQYFNLRLLEGGLTSGLQPWIEKLI